MAWYDIKADLQRSFDESEMGMIESYKRLLLHAVEKTPLGIEEAKDMILSAIRKAYDKAAEELKDGKQ